MLAAAGAHPIILPADRTLCWNERSKSADRGRASSLSREGGWSSSVSRERSTTSRPPSIPPSRPSSAGYLPRPASAGSLCSTSQQFVTDGACRRADTQEVAISDDDVNSSIKRRHQGPWPVQVERKCAIVRQQQRAGRDGIIKIPHLLGFKLDQLRLEDSWRLVVETCHQCESHVQFMRHDPEQYKNALQVLVLAANQWESALLSCIQLPTPDLGQRMGACEVFLLPPRMLETSAAPAYLLHSKLLTKTWPNVRSLVLKMELEMPALDVAWSSMVMKTQDARASLEWRLQTAEETTQQLQEQLMARATLEDELQDTKRAAQILESGLAAAEAEKARRDVELSRMMTLEEQLKTAQEERIKTTDQNAELTLALKTATEVQQNLQLKLEALEEQNGTLQSGLLEAKGAQADKEILTQTLQSAQEALRASEIDAKQRLTQVDEEKAEHAARAAQLDNMVLALSGSVQSATASSEQWKDEFNAIREEKLGLVCQISEIQAGKEKAAEELTAAKEELRRTKDAVEKLKSDLTAASDDNYELRRELKEMEQQSEEKLVELSALRIEEREKAEEEHDKLKEELAGIKLKNSKLEEKLKAEEEVRETAFAKYEEGTENLRSQLKTSTDETKQLKDQLADCKAEQDQLAKELNASRIALSKLVAENEEWKKALQKMNEDKEAELEGLSPWEALQKMNEDKEAELEGLKKDGARKNEDLAESARKNDDLAERCRQLEEELETTHATHAEILKASQRPEDSQLARTSANEVALQDEAHKNHELADKNRQLEKDVARKNDDLAESARKNDDLAGRCRQLEEELAATHAEFLKASQRPEDSQLARTSANEAALQEEARKNHELAEKNRQLEKELEAALAKLVEASQKPTDSQQARRSIDEAASQEGAPDNLELQQKCQQLEKEKAELESKLSALQKRIQQVQWDILSASDEKVELEEELEAAKEELEAAKRELEAAKEALRAYEEKNDGQVKSERTKEMTIPARVNDLTQRDDSNLSGLKRIYFAFDQTISTIHTFKQLAGWEPGVAPPASSSERGQIQKIKMLNDTGDYVYSPRSNSVVASPLGTDGADSWTCGALGGHQRIQDLGDIFSALTDVGTKLTIIHNGNVGPCKFLLDHEGLLGFFEEVYGMLGRFYGESEFDQAHQKPSPQYEGTTQNQLEDSKAALIRRHMASEGLAHDEVLLVDDDPDDISSVNGICRSLFVSERKGLTGQQLEELKRIAGIEAGTEEAAEQATVPVPVSASPATVVNEAQKPAPQLASVFAPFEKLDRLVTLEEDEEDEEEDEGSTSEEEDEEPPSQMTIAVASAMTSSSVKGAPPPPPKNPLPPPPSKSPSQKQALAGQPLLGASPSLGSSQQGPGQSQLPPSKKAPPPPPSGSPPQKQTLAGHPPSPSSSSDSSQQGSGQSHAMPCSTPGPPKTSASQQPKPPPKQSTPPPPPPPKQPIATKNQLFYEY